jgi:hypothetical protein
MPISIPAALFYYLLLVASARAQVSAPNCNNTLLAWVGSLSTDARFVSITARLSHRAGVFIHSRLIRSNKVPAWSQRTWRRCATTAVSSTCTFGTSVWDLMGML